MDRVKRIWYLSPMRAAKVQASLRIRAVSPEPSLLAHTSLESRRTFRQKARSLAPLNGRACAVKVCHDGMLEDTNSLDGAHIHLRVGMSACMAHVKMLTRNVPSPDIAVHKSTFSRVFHRNLHHLNQRLLQVYSWKFQQFVPISTEFIENLLYLLSFNLFRK